jgi:hypothetical protein
MAQTIANKIETLFKDDNLSEIERYVQYATFDLIDPSVKAFGVPNVRINFTDGSFLMMGAKTTKNMIVDDSDNKLPFSSVYIFMPRIEHGGSIGHNKMGIQKQYSIQYYQILIEKLETIKHQYINAVIANFVNGGEFTSNYETEWTFDMVLKYINYSHIATYPITVIVMCARYDYSLSENFINHPILKHRENTNIGQVHGTIYNAIYNNPRSYKFINSAVKLFKHLVDFELIQTEEGMLIEKVFFKNPVIQNTLDIKQVMSKEEIHDSMLVSIDQILKKLDNFAETMTGKIYLLEQKQNKMEKNIDIIVDCLKLKKQKRHGILRGLK